MPGSHGGMGKAGKVKDHTPKIERTTNSYKRIPRVRFRRRYEKILKSKEEAQKAMSKSKGFKKKAEPRIGQDWGERPKQFVSRGRRF